MESDSEVLVQMVTKRDLEAPWQLRSRWKNCLQMLNGKQFLITHIHREGNKVADCLANSGFRYDDLTWWLEVPDCAKETYDRNLHGLPEFRICKKG